jgi:hypothetical protein
VRCAGRCFRSALLDLNLGQVVAGQTLANHWEVVAAIESEQFDVVEQLVGDDRVERRLQQLEVVEVRARNRDTNGDPVRVGSNGPFVAEFGPINRGLAGSSTTTGCFVDRPVDCNETEIEANDAVAAGACSGFEFSKYARCDPLIASADWCRTPCTP